MLENNTHNNTLVPNNIEKIILAEILRILAISCIPSSWCIPWRSDSWVILVDNTQVPSIPVIIPLPKPCNISNTTHAKQIWFTKRIFKRESRHEKNCINFSKSVLQF